MRSIISGRLHYKTQQDHYIVLLASNQTNVDVGCVFCSFATLFLNPALAACQQNSGDPLLIRLERVLIDDV